MTPHDEFTMLNFCNNQRQLTPVSWFGLNHVEPAIVATCAIFLTGLDPWRQYKDELFAIAENLYPGSVGHFSKMILLVDFDCSRFRSMLEMIIEKSLYTQVIANTKITVRSLD